MKKYLTVKMRAVMLMDEVNRMEKYFCCGKFLNLAFQRVFSSVGSERCFDRAEVTGSSPVKPTEGHATACLFALKASIRLVMRGLSISNENKRKQVKWCLFRCPFWCPIFKDTTGHQLLFCPFFDKQFDRFLRPC